MSGSTFSKLFVAVFALVCLACLPLPALGQRGGGSHGGGSFHGGGGGVGRGRRTAYSRGSRGFVNADGRWHSFGSGGGASARGGWRSFGENRMGAFNRFGARNFNRFRDFDDFRFRDFDDFGFGCLGCGFGFDSGFGPLWWWWDPYWNRLPFWYWPAYGAY